MPRQARLKSESGIYHVMLRGINRQQIFNDEEDCKKFIQVLRKCKAISEFQLFAYCLMGNHIHLLIKPDKEPLEQIFRRIGSRFVYWYNTKYRRSGHLFQDRYKSEPIDNESYFLAVMRYIHQNPVKAELCKTPAEYKYSSYNEYLHGQQLADCEFVFGIINKEEFIKFNDSFGDDKFLDIEGETKVIRITDEQAQAVIYKHSKCHNASEFQLLNPKSRDEFIVTFKQNGLSVRQISRLTGASYYDVYKA